MKKRLDVLLVDLGFFDTRAKSQANIMANNVLVNDTPITKVGTKVDVNSNIRIRNKIEYVSRGAFKLKKALDYFTIDPNNMICADIGSSTGGFTDLLIKRGAKMVYAVDVGRNQLDYQLRINDSVIVMENTNARYLTKNDFQYEPELITIDVSFISLTLILPVAINISKAKGEIIALIKPQFEIGREIKGFRGVVKNQDYQIKAISKIINFLKNDITKSICIEDLTFSPIKGPKGNHEFLLYLTKKTGYDRNYIKKEDIINVVNQANLI